MARTVVILLVLASLALAGSVCGSAVFAQSASDPAAKPVSVHTKSVLDNRAIQGKEIWLAGLSARSGGDAAGAGGAGELRVAFVQDMAGWFPTWSLRLSAPAGILPQSYVDGREGGREFITLVRSVRPPFAGQSLEASLVYNPATQRASILVVSGTDGELVRVSVPLRAVEGPAPPDAAHVRSLYPYIDSITSGAAWEGDHVPIEFRRDFSWELIGADGNRTFGAEFPVDSGLGMRVRWPKLELPGELRVIAEQGGEAALLGSTGWRSEPWEVKFAPERIPLGDSSLRLVYDDGKSEHVLVDQPLRILRGTLVADVTLGSRSPERVTLRIGLSSEQAWRLEPVRVEAAFHALAGAAPGGSAVGGGDAPGTVREHTFSVGAGGRHEFTVEVPVPPIAGRLEVSISGRPGVAIRGGGAIQLSELPVIWANSIHPTMTAEIGEPALIALGEPVPEFAVSTVENVTLSAVVFFEGAAADTVPEQVIPAGQERVVRLPKLKIQPGTYEVRFTIERADGIRNYLSRYFTIYDSGDPLPPTASRIVHEGPDGRLRYVPDYLGNRIPDFSHAGYMGGGVAIPDVPVRAVVEPSPGSQDDRTRIQAAIDQVSRMTPDENGFRGAVLLKAGTYRVNGSLSIAASGVVVRGEGDGEDGTVIVATARRQHDLIQVRGSGSMVEEPGTRRRIVDIYVPVGARTFRVDDASPFRVGDAIVVYRPGTAEWIRDLGMDDPILPSPWRPEEYDFHFERTITAIDGNEITIDVPIVQAMQYEYGGGYVYKGGVRGRIRQVGIENLRLVSEYDASKGVNDEDHAWNAITLNYVEDAWVRRVTGLHFGYAVVNVLREAKRVTVEDSASIDPISQITGSRRYSFNVTGSQVLVQRVYARNGRHDFVLGSRVRGPNVFLFAEAERAHSQSEPHHRWSVGTLFDNVSTMGQTVGMQAVNRGTSGTGHGWSGAYTVFWNGRALLIAVGKPPTAQNFAIGARHVEPEAPVFLQGALSWIISQGRHWDPLVPQKFAYQGVPLVGDGYIESPGAPVTPESLYLKQLEDRLGPQALKNTGW